LNKKVTIVAVALIVAMMLSSIALVLAAPKEKVDFALYIRGGLEGNFGEVHEDGYLVSSPNNRWVQPQVPPPDGYNVWHFNNVEPWIATFIEVVVNGETFLMERLDYEATISGNINWVTMHFNVKVDEIVTIYTNEDKEEVWGTIEMRTLKQNPWQAPQTGLYGNFVGHGTEELAGVKVHGGDVGTVDYGGELTRARIGTAMGWPTP
jgi:hypothetical protein